MSVSILAVDDETDVADLFEAVELEFSIVLSALGWVV
jgi:hypothetical protein